MKMSRFFNYFFGLVFCIILIVSGIDVARLSAMPIVVYADQVSAVDEAAESDENSDADEAEEDSENTDDAGSDNGDDDKEEEDVNTDSNTEDSDTDVAEEDSDVAEKSEEVKSEDLNTSVNSEPEELVSNGEKEAEKFELSDKTGSVQEIIFSRPERKTEAPTEAETVEHTEPETEQETEPETQPETQEETQEETTQEETAPETVAETQPETIPEPETVAETEAVKEVPTISHTTHDGGITTYDNSEMDYINNLETPVVVVEEVIHEPQAIEVQQPVIIATEHRSTPKTGESDDLYMLLACILVLIALLINAPSFYVKKGTTLLQEVKSSTRINSVNATKVKVYMVNATVKTNETRRSHKTHRRALAFLVVGQTC